MSLLKQLSNRLRSLPVFLQSERAECGLVCLAMLCNFHGLQVTVNWLRQQYPLAEGGASANQLINIARELQLDGRALQIELHELKLLALPAILHWDMNHFVVLKNCTRNAIVIHDPAIGVRRYSGKEIGAHVTGVAIELWPAQFFKKEQRGKTVKLRELIKASDNYFAPMFRLFFLSLCIQLLALLSPFYLQLIIDEGLATLDPGLIGVFAVIFLAISLGKTGLIFQRGRMLTSFSAVLGFQMVSSVFRHLISLPTRYFESRQLGDLLSRFNSVDNVRRFISGEMITVIVDGLFSIISLMLLFRINSRLALLMLALICLFALLRFISLGLEKTHRQQLISDEAKQKSRFIENVRAVTMLKTYGIVEQRIQDWLNFYVAFTNSSMHLSLFQNQALALQNLIFGIDQIVTLYFGALFVQAGEMTVGSLMAFIFLKQHFISSVSAMLPKLFELKLLHVELDRIADITGEETEAKKALLPVVSPSVQGELELQNLSFRYPGCTERILDQLNFKIEPGQCAVLVGPSGSGKTTLLKLLMGLIEAESGSILIDGFGRGAAGLDYQGEQLAAVLQSDIILSGSLHYNITLGTDSGNTMRLEKACKTAQLLPDILRLRMGFETPLGEIGSCLSTGQEQRVLLARALYRQPRILVLDEALSHVEVKLARTILADVREQQITVLLVTHDMQLTELADMQVSLGKCGGKGGGKSYLCQGEV